MTDELYHPVPGFRPSTPPVTSSTLTDAVSEHPVLVIHFWAEWNGVDVPMDRVIQEVKNTVEKRFHFVSCDVDSPGNLDLCERCNVANVPFLAVFVDGREKRGIMGLRTPEELIAELEKRLSDSQSQQRWWQFWRIARA